MAVVKQLLSVGNCGFDHSRLVQRLKSWFDVEITAAEDRRAALTLLQERSYDLILVNRVFDASGESAIELIAELKQTPKFAAIPVMLISNYPEYQQEAVRKGAVPGFGKNHLNGNALQRLLAPYLATQGRESARVANQ